MARRFFAEDSYWNTKIEENPVLHPKSAHFIELLELDHEKQAGFHMNLHAWTTPIYEVTKDTPTVRVERRMKYAPGEGGMFYIHSEEYIDEDHPVGHAPGFGEEVPIPEDAIPDKESDSHLALVDYERGIAWDMWAAQKRPDGVWWCNSGIKYDLYGSGVFNPADFPIHNGESIHMYGPSHASGIPITAGMILYDEIMAGKIEHKLMWACKRVALLEHIFPPAIWTDGAYPNGVPQGALIQLDPSLDLEQFGLSPAEKVVARALQEYGAALGMYADSTTLFGEGLWPHPGKDWHGLLEEDSMFKIPFKHYRVVQSGKTVEKGMVPMQHPGAFSTYYHKTGLPKGITLEEE